MTQETEMAEEATGIAQSPGGLGKLYARGGIELTDEEAQDRILANECVEAPNAGAGSYRKFFVDRVLYAELKVVEWSSSAGDWTFAVRDDSLWRLAFQTNRYPRHGFSYSVDNDLCWGSFEGLCEDAFKL
jgi:hypothetical protein